MIKIQELKTQIEELGMQNDLVLVELDQVKNMLLNYEKTQKEQQSQQQLSPTASQQSGGSQGGLDQQQTSVQGQTQQQVSGLANDLLQIKDLVEKLEQQTTGYVSASTNGSLTEKDVVNLVLTLINGMVDWSSEFVSSKSSGSGQIQ